MTERYRYNPRPRSPTFNPARVSLPINLSGFGHPAAHEHHLHVVPTSRRETPSSHSRSGSSYAGNAGTVTTTYKIKAEPPPRTSSAQANHSKPSRRRSSTHDSNTIRPTVVTTTSRQHKPVVLNSGGRPASPMKNHYRSSEEDYYTVPGSSQHAHSHHTRYSGGMDTAEFGRSSTGNTLRIGSGRQEAVYNSNRPRSTYPVPVARHTEPVGEDYGDDGYGYTNPRDLVQYDLNQPVRDQHQRSASIDRSRTARPNSISGYGDVVPRAYDTRERGPPLTTRGFDRIPRGATWDAPATVRMPVVPPQPMIEAVQRPARIENVEPVRRNSLTRPVPVYHDRERERRRDSREDYYEHRDAEPRRRRDSTHRSEKPRYVENPVEQRGFGIRTEAPPPPRQPSRPDMAERADRVERAEYDYPLDRSERNDRLERAERPERVERFDRQERFDHGDRGDRNDWSDRRDRPDRPDDDRDRDHKSGRDLVATGLGIAGAALGLKSIKNARDDREERDRDSDNRDEREDRKWREYDDEPRRRRETRDDRSPPESDTRDPKERRNRDDDRERVQPPRDMPPAPKDNPVTSRDIPPQARDVPSREVRERNSDPGDFLDLSGRNPKERPSSRNERPNSRNEPRTERDSDSDRRERRRARNEEPQGSSRSRSDSADAVGSGFHHPHPAALKDNAAAPATFNPKDTMDLKALKEALNSKDNAMPKEALPVSSSRDPRTSTANTPAEATQIRSDLTDDRRSRELVSATENIPPRVVSPPRPQAEMKPAVKGILRAPKEKFPEDPSPIREGVAPLKDAKKDGVPPDARWTKISRKLVNPEALELGKERYEARDDFVIVLRVLSRDEVQGYAEVTQKLRAAREDAEEQASRDERRRARRERHERHKRERSRGERTERSDRRRREKEREREIKESESDTTEDDEGTDGPKLLEPAPSRRRAGSNNLQDVMMSGGISGPPPIEDPNAPGQYLNYTRNPPPPSSLVAQSAGSSRRDRN